MFNTKLIALLVSYSFIQLSAKVYLFTLDVSLTLDRQGGQACLRENMELSVQERILRAFLDLVILRVLLHQPMTAYEIDNAILKKFGVKRSPNVVYTRLAAMELKGLISCAHSKHGRIYSITEKGRKMADTASRVVEEIQRSAPILLG